MRMTGSEAIVASLERAGVTHVFGLCGHANLSMLDALEASGIEFVPVRNEQNAAHMADAFYRISHRPAGVLTTIGPGLANAVTGVWEASLDSSAMIVISGNVPSYMIGRDAFQELSLHSDGSQSEVYRPFVKRAWRVAAASSIPYVVQRAFNLATTGRPGPVLIDVPMDYFGAVEDFHLSDPARHCVTGRRVRGDQEEIRRAAKRLVEADRPLIHAGNGCTLSEASEELLALATYLAAPVSTSMQAQGIIDNTHDLAVGYPGAVGTPTGNAATNQADVVLALGTRFSELETSSWDPKYSFRFAEDAALIQVDIDPHEIGRAYPVDVGVVGDARAVLSDLLDEVRALTSPRQSSGFLESLCQLRDEWDVERMSAVTDAEPILVQRLLAELATQLDPETILLADAGTFRHGVGQYVPIRRPQSWFLPSGFGTMGGAAPAALGAQMAAPDRPVVCIIGDGGMSANDHALATAVEWNLPVSYIVLNNHSWDSIETYQHLAYESRVYGTRLQTREGEPYNPDFVGLARAYGLVAERVTEPAYLGEAVAGVLDRHEPTLLEVVVAPTRLKATGRWDVGDVLRAEGDFKRERRERAQTGH